jgi:hypothetical protein
MRNRTDRFKTRNYHLSIPGGRLAINGETLKGTQMQWILPQEGHVLG